MISFRAFLKIIRWKNLGLLSLSLLLLKIQVFPFFNLLPQLNILEFVLFMLTILSTAAAGNIQNDILDVYPDRINKPAKKIVENKITISKAYQWYFAILIGSLTTGGFLSFQIKNLALFLFFTATHLLLFLYNRYLKRIALIGNISIALLLVCPMLLLSYLEGIVKNSYALYFIMMFACFAFVLNLLREIIKDQEDIDGDHAAGFKTIPILIGQKRTTQLINILGVLFIFYLGQVWELFLNKKIEKIFYLLAIVLPYLYFLFCNFKSKRKKYYENSSQILKVIMGFGLILMLILTR